MRPELRRTLEVLVAGVLVAVAVWIPFAIRARNIRALEAQYTSIRPGQPIQEVLLKNHGFQLFQGVPPEKFQDLVWWETVGNRTSCTHYAFTRGGFLAVNVGYMVGFDSAGRVAFKCIGNG